MKILSLAVAATLLLGGISANSFAAPAVGSGASQLQKEEVAASAENPVLVLQSGMAKLIAFLRGDHDEAQLGQFLSSEIAPFFDFPFMAKSAAGPLSRYMTEEQLLRLERKLEVTFLSAMTDKLSRYDNQDVVYLPPRFNSVDRATVSALINNPGNYPGRIDFRLHLTGDGWKIFDITANGASAIAFYRTYFRKSMRAAQ